MKKKVMIAAAIAVMAGAGAYFGNASNSPSSDGRSDLLLENAEALSDMEIELPEVPIFCNAGGYGRCWSPGISPWIYLYMVHVVTQDIQVIFADPSNYRH